MGPSNHNSFKHFNVKYKRIGPLFRCLDVTYTASDFSIEHLALMVRETCSNKLKFIKSDMAQSTYNEWSNCKQNQGLICDSKPTRAFEIGQRIYYERGFCKCLGNVNCINL